MTTATELQTELIALLRGSELALELSGEVYRIGTRPRDSKREDITVAITALTAGQRQRARARLSIYVPDIARVASAVSDPDLARAARLERLATDWALSLTTDRTGDLLIRLAEGASLLHLDAERQTLIALTLGVEIINTDNNW